MAPRSLSLTSYLVLGLIDQAGEATPYDLKQMATAVSGADPAPRPGLPRDERLAGQGLLIEDREQHGRRRRRFRITPAGRTALEEWLATPTNEFTRLRDPGLLSPRR